MTLLKKIFCYGCTVCFLLVFGFVCFSLGSSQVNIPCTNVIQEGNDEEHRAPSSAQILSGIRNQSDQKLKTSLASLQLPNTEENIQTDQLCPNTEEFSEENERKLDWIQSQCNNTLSSFTESVRSKLTKIREIFYFPKSLLGWCPVYKAATSNVFAHFCSDYYDNKTCQDKHVKMWRFNGGFRKREDFKEKDPPPKDEKRFLVVRDPFRRLLSLYRNKVELLSHPIFKDIFTDFMIHYRPIRWNVDFDQKISADQAISYAESMTEGGTHEKPEEDNPYLYPPYPTFKEIVDATIAGWKNNHVIPASQRCGPCGSTPYDFLLKVETFDCDLKNMFNLTGNLRLLTNSERWMTNQTPALDMTMFYSYYSTLSTEQLDGLLYFYQDDCLLFQYPCAEHVENIKQFKLLNPNHKHEYKNTWSGIYGDPTLLAELMNSVIIFITLIKCR
ncbi:uncharacterized protein LOC134811631 isoform X1 [Bolinopsis microptera]|uniref:uncharacterized protein LOC134811631 isoform X1 n=1 Tax=Bolinopsis microptera TaxID=2820187 RepID=UPI003078CA99